MEWKVSGSDIARRSKGSRELLFTLWTKGAAHGVAVFDDGANSFVRKTFPNRLAALMRVQTGYRRTVDGLRSCAVGLHVQSSRDWPELKRIGLGRLVAEHTQLRSEDDRRSYRNC